MVLKAFIIDIDINIYINKYRCRESRRNKNYGEWSVLVFEQLSQSMSLQIEQGSVIVLIPCHVLLYLASKYLM
jgi:hypothetical protein